MLLAGCPEVTTDKPDDSFMGLDPRRNPNNFCDVENIPVGVGGTGPFNVKGTIRYERLGLSITTRNPDGGIAEQGGFSPDKTETLPVRNATVLVLKGAKELSRAMTTDTGEYQLSYDAPAGETVTVAAVTQSQTPCIRVQDNTDRNSLWAMSKDIQAGPAATVDLLATHGWNGKAFVTENRLAAPFAVLDTAYTAASAFRAVRPVQFRPLKLNWSPNNRPERSNPPQPNDRSEGKIGGAFFDPEIFEIFLGGKDGADTDEFDAAVIAHEWGHYFEATLSRSDSPGGPHGANAREFLDPRIAFGEGWGTGLAASVLPKPFYIDTYFGLSTGLSRGFGYNLEEGVVAFEKDKPGAFAEFQIARFIYDVNDAANEPFDNVNAGLGGIYDIMTGPQKATPYTTTLASFVTALKTQPNIDASAVDALLKNYNVGPITTGLGDGDDVLRGMFTVAASLPIDTTLKFDGTQPFNSRFQNQFFVFTGTGQRVTVTATANQTTRIQVFEGGNKIAENFSMTATGLASTNFDSKAGVIYTYLVTGFGEVDRTYDVRVVVIAK